MHITLPDLSIDALSAQLAQALADYEVAPLDDYDDFGSYNDSYDETWLHTVERIGIGVLAVPISGTLPDGINLLIESAGPIGWDAQGSVWFGISIPGNPGGYVSRTITERYSTTNREATGWDGYCAILDALATEVILLVATWNDLLGDRGSRIDMTGLDQAHREVLRQCERETWRNAENGEPESQTAADTAADIAQWLYTCYRACAWDDGAPGPLAAERADQTGHGNV